MSDLKQASCNHKILSLSPRFTAAFRKHISGRMKMNLSMDMEIWGGKVVIPRLVVLDSMTILRAKGLAF